MQEAGERQFTFTFQGQGKFKGLNDTLTYTSSPDQTNTNYQGKADKHAKNGTDAICGKNTAVR